MTFHDFVARRLLTQDLSQVSPPNHRHARLSSAGSETLADSSALPSGGSDTLVESSLQLPAAATKEFLKVALQLQAKDLKVRVLNRSKLREAKNGFNQQSAVIVLLQRVDDRSFPGCCIGSYFHMLVGS